MNPNQSPQTVKENTRGQTHKQSKTENYKTISNPKDLKSPVLDEMEKNIRRIKTAFQELEMFRK